MSDLKRKIMAYFFGVKYVWLIDFDGEMNVRPVKWIGGRPYASRRIYNVHDVGLLDGGALSNGRYVVSWEPYDPFAPKRLPRPANETVPFRIVK